MLPKLLWCRAVLPVFALVLAGCGPDLAGPDPDPDLATDTLTVLGHGLIQSRYTAEVAARGDWAYTSTWGNRVGASGNAVFVWDVAGAVPVLVDSLIVLNASTTGDVQISDDGALLVVATEFSPGSIVIYDRSTPATPAHIATFSSPGTNGGVHTVKLGTVAGRQYAFLSITPGIGPARLVIVDITDPAAPVEVLVREMGSPFVHDVFVRDGILFTALWHAGVTIWDIGGAGEGGTPADPVEIVNFIPAGGSIHNIWWFHNPDAQEQRYLFLGEEGPGNVGTGTSSGDIHVVDISDLDQPEQVAVYSLPGAGTHNFWMDEASGILYAAYYNGGVRAIDVRGDLSACTSAQRTVDGHCNLRLMGREVGVALFGGTFIWGVVHQGTHVYASDMLSGIYKIDASSLVR
jgi:hypothetical protein